MIYTPDVFYRTREIDIDTKKEILEDAYAISYNWWVDRLDCNKSFARQRIDMSFEDIMKKLTKNCFFVIIHRKGYPPTDDWNKWKGEIAFSTMTTGPEYYLWIHVEEEDLNKLVEKYGLKI